VTARPTILSGLLGKPWQANAKGPDAYDCWHLAAVASASLFARTLPTIHVPAAPTWPWMIDTIRAHPEREHWRELPPHPMGLVTAADGAIVLMSRSSHPAHIGLWLAAERGVLHCDADFGVVLDSLVGLRTGGWRRLQFFEPA
jgi:hypothetical protein